MTKIILASASPRRKELLGKLQIPFIVEKSNYKEDNNLELEPLELAKVLSAGKAGAVAERHKGEGDYTNIVGLPLPALIEELKNFGINL